MVNPNVVGERMKILWYAVYLKSWLRLVLFSFTLVSSSVCLVFLFTSFESKNLKMCMSKTIFYEQGTLVIAFSMIIEQQHAIFPHVRPACVNFFSWPFIQSSQYIRPKVTIHKCVSIIRTKFRLSNNILPWILSPLFSKISKNWPCWVSLQKWYSFSNFSCMFLNPNNFFQSEL